MIERLQKNLRTTLSVLLQMGEKQQLRYLLLVFIFIFISDAASNALYEALELPLWVMPLILVLLILATIIVIGRAEQANDKVIPPMTGGLPSYHEGLVLFLSLFNSRGDQVDGGLLGQNWRRQQLQKAVDDPQIDWPDIIDRFTHSNMQPALEAIRYHYESGALKHVWLISTLDLVTQDEKLIQEGSQHLAPLFEKICGDGLGWELTFHHQDRRLHIQPYEVKDAFQSVEYVFNISAPQMNLRPNQIIADLTSGRAPMTGGMVLACSPRGWNMQYTTTDLDPAKQGPGDTPLPLNIAVDARSIWRTALEAIQREAI